MEITIVELFLGAALLLQIVFQFFILIGIQRMPKSSDLDLIEKLPISIVIAARNEGENLLQCIPLLLDQDYPDFEVILVNDRSTDNSLQVMRAFEEKDSRITVVDVSSDRYSAEMATGKKFALTMGIKAASHDSIALTDADCEVEKGWLNAMAAGFAQDAGFVIGTGNYRSSNLIGSIHSSANFRFAQQYFAATSFKVPFGAVGRSMGISRELFYRVQGFKQHMSIASGSDDLLLQSIKKIGKVVSAPQAISVSDSPKTFGSWFRQRSRHVKASTRYGLGLKLLLPLYELTILVSWLSLAFMPLLSFENAVALLVLFALRITLTTIGNYMSRNIFSHPLSTVELLLFEFPAAILNSVFSSFGLLTKPTEWTREK